MCTKLKRFHTGEVNESKCGISAILTLKTKCGDELPVWAPKRFAEDLEDECYQFVYKIGLKTSADGNEYFDYELMQSVCEY